MRWLANKTANRKLSLNSFLLSLIFNLTLLLALSLIRERAAPLSKEAVDVKFVSIPKERLQRRAIITIPRNVTYVTKPLNSPRASMRKEILSPQPDSKVSIGAVSADDFTPGGPSAFLQSALSSSSQSQSAAGWKRGGGASSGPTRSGSGALTGGLGGVVAPHQPPSIISGSGDKLSGYYNISLVRYEDTSDIISADALAQLALAMNRWTKIRTKVIKDPIMLESPELLQVPMIYIASRRPFAFSERERKNLRRYFASGGFLLFSNASNSESEKRGVANSIEFELWKVLDDSPRDLIDLRKGHQIYSSFFRLPDSLRIRGISLNGRVIVAYEDSGYGDAWLMGKDSNREPYLKLGVDIIVYALLTSPMVQRE